MFIVADGEGKCCEKIGELKLCDAILYLIEPASRPVLVRPTIEVFQVKIPFLHRHDFAHVSEILGAMLTDCPPQFGDNYVLCRG